MDAPKAKAVSPTPASTSRPVLAKLTLERSRKASTYIISKVGISRQCSFGRMRESCASGMLGLLVLVFVDLFWPGHLGQKRGFTMPAFQRPRRIAAHPFAGGDVAGDAGTCRQPRARADV